MIDFTDLTDSATDAAALTRFYDSLYVAEFPDPDERESLANMLDYLRKKAAGWYGRNNYHILLATEDGHPVGGSIADYLAEPNVGVIEFILVSGSTRGSGVGGKLLARTEELLAADAVRSGGGPLAAIVAEMNDPFLPAAVPDNLDPARRALIWHRWGYAGLDFPYAQPALSAAQTPVTNLIMIGKPLRPDWQNGFPAATVLLAVHEYLRWAMRIDDPDTDGEYQRMAGHLARRDTVRTLSLARYVGSPLQVTDITRPDEPDFAPTMRQYREVFGDGPLAVEETEFRLALAETAGYHLWAVRAREAGPISGFASFFGLRTAGFCGYLALTGELRGTGALRPLVALAEQRLLGERPRTRGWYFEVGRDTEVGPLRAVGCWEIAIDYRQPSLRDAGHRVSTRLLYKQFGRCYGPPALPAEDVLAAVRDILGVVYGVARPRTHPTYVEAATVLAGQDLAPLRRPADRQRLIDNAD